MPISVSRAAVPGAKAPSEVWPQFVDETARHCVALFIDIRGSSAMSAEPGLDSTTIAHRTHAFVSIAKDLLDQGGAKEPTFVKSLGDGLLCVWDISDLADEQHADEKRNLLTAALCLEAKIGQELATAWKRRPDIEVGMGLAAGDAAKARVGTSIDYFGYTVNLASKLQGFARPCGLVVDNKYLEEDEKWPKRYSLEVREFIVPMIGPARSKYYVTPKVFRHHDWTCLAWPGFAIDSGDVPFRPRGLNTKGITVVTHEGIQGKIGTLQIWPLNDPRNDTGDEFELIIDDFDGLSIMLEERTLLLEARTKHSSELLRAEVSDPLGVAAEREGFLFVPIRCGLNALAWNTRHDLSRVKRFSEILSRIKGSFKVALYDNGGASLPVLLRCLPQMRLKRIDDVFEADEDDFKALIRLLHRHQKRYQIERPKAKLFTAYQKIDSLAKALQAGQSVHAVLGGGAWLANPQRVRSIAVACGIPTDDIGFLWMEGCALLTAAHSQVDYILEFIKQEILAAGYQLSLISAHPYGATPVTPKALQQIISEASNLAKIGVRKGNGAGRHKTHSPNSLLARHQQAAPTLKESSMLFSSVDNLNTNIVIRRRPSNLPEWRKAWEEIREEFCQVISN